MQYRVPQHIDQEDKVLGPLTFVQLIYALIGGAILLILFAILPIGLFTILAIPLIALTAAFALLKVQDQPFSRFFVAILVYLKLPKHRIWQDLDNPVGSDGLGQDYMEAVQRDQAPIVGTAPNTTLTTNIASGTTPHVQTVTPVTSPPVTPAKILTIQQEGKTSTSVATTPTGAPVSAPTQVASSDVFDQLVGTAPPPAPARRLTVQVVKGGG